MRNRHCPVVKGVRLFCTGIGKQIGQFYNIKLIATVSAIDSIASDVLEVEMV